MLTRFEEIAPKIVKESADSISTDHPIIDYYDENFYFEKIEGFFWDVNKNTLKKIITDYKEQIDDIFLKNYKKL